MLTYCLQQLMFALAIGSIYGLIALGYTMVYGVMRLINFAHGEFFMLGPYVFTLIVSGLVSTGLVHGTAEAVIGSIGTFIAVGLLGVLVERVAYRPLRNYGRLAPMLSALGMSIVLQNAVRVIVGPQPVRFPAIFPNAPVQALGGAVTVTQVGIFAVTLVLMGGLTVFVNGTRLGVWIRAASESWTTSRLLGIRVNRAISLVFFVGPGLGAMAGIMYASNYGIMQPTMGSAIGLKAFTAAILGGIGSIPGAMLGGFLLGAIEVLGTAVLPVVSGGLFGTEYRDVFAFAVLILVLLFRPGGLLGAVVTEESAVAKKDY